MSTVVGVFQHREDAERAASELRDKGLHERISIAARGEKGEGREGTRGEPGTGGHAGRGGQGGAGGAGGDMSMREDVSTGTWTGAAIGGAGGLLAAAGLFAVPGIGPILALGPLAAGLTGAATGGLVGGLVDLGIPAERSEYYQEQVQQGKILCAVESDEGQEEEVRKVLSEHGARDIETH
ncbi:MAG: DUF1269 domain-containing protein [Bacillota bacterium]|nr:DUF1269 domain-containing protein [Bacillota bacterium]